MSSNTTDTKKEKKGPPQIVKLNKALALAEKWVSNMSKLPAEDESFETQSRPSRLGLGAKVPHASTFVPSDDPLERKLYYKLNAQKRKAAKIAEELAPAAADGDGDDEDNEDSRTSAFEKKKRAANPLTPPLGKKKRRNTITVMTSLVALSFYGASQFKFHWVERYDILLVGSALCLVGILTLIFCDHDYDGAGGSIGEHLHRKIIVH